MFHYLSLAASIEAARSFFHTIHTRCESQYILVGWCCVLRPDDAKHYRTPTTVAKQRYQLCHKENGIINFCIIKKKKTKTKIYTEEKYAIRMSPEKLEYADPNLNSRKTIRCKTTKSLFQTQS